MVAPNACSLGANFASKDGLVAATLAEGVDSARAALQAAIDAVPADAPPKERLRAALRGHLAALHANDDRAASVVRMVETLPANLRVEHSKHERCFARVWRDVLARDQDEGVVRTDVNLRALPT
jgi:AcrR family transcriptional regulator